MNIPSAAGALSLIACLCTVTASNAAPCATEAPYATAVYLVADEPSWIFARGTYTHDPYTGARVAQYMRTPPVEPLEDQRMVTSRYRRSRTNLRGAHGSVDTYYEVQAWGNGRGGIDAEWERFHDAWKESYLQNGFYNQSPGFGTPWGGSPWGQGGGFGAPGLGFGFPGFGFPGGGFPSHGNGGPWQGGGSWHGGGHGGGGNHGGGGHHGGDGNQGGDEDGGGED